MTLLLLFACTDSTSVTLDDSGEDTSVEGDADADSDTDTDTDADSDADTDVQDPVYEGEGKVLGEFPDGFVTPLWITEGDALYAWGDGVASGGTFTFAFYEDMPPEQATIVPGFIGLAALGIGVAPIEEGLVTDTDQLFGFSPQHFVLWRATAGPVDEVPWLGAFPQGYSCSVCAPGGPDGKDILVPSDCQDVEILTGSALETAVECKL